MGELKEKLKIYRISIDMDYYDLGYSTFIIVARSEERAKEIAQLNHADEGADVWKKDSTVELIGYPIEELEEGIVLGSYHDIG